MIVAERLLLGERLDDLQNGYEIIQDSGDFCFGIDAVLLAWFAKVKPGEMVLDMCCGTGIVPILLKARNPFGHYTGLEIQEKSVALARRSVAYNQLEDSISIVKGDIKEAAARFGAASFHVVTCNPPYMTGKHGLLNASESKAIARHEILCTLEDVISQAVKVLTGKGRFYMIHRPFRLAEIMSVMTRYHLEPKRMRLVHPYGDKEPNLVLIEGLLHGNARITVEKPLVVYERPGRYTREFHEICYGTCEWPVQT
jgi:tRNA1(Val) A37 N6-methylase TrmN6